MTNFATALPTLLSPDRICNLIKLSNLCKPLGAYMCEFGVYAGGSLEILAKHNQGNDMFGIDSFQGLPKESRHDFHKEGDFAEVDYHKIAGYFGMLYPHVRIVRGFSPDVFSFFDPDETRFSFVHVDVDMYQSVLDALDFFVPRMLTNGMILFDDYKVRSTPGCEKAIQEFLHNAKPQIQYADELKYYPSADAPSHNQFLIVK